MEGYSSTIAALEEQVRVKQQLMEKIGVVGDYGGDKGNGGK